MTTVANIHEPPFNSHSVVPGAVRACNDCNKCCISLCFIWLWPANSADYYHCHFSLEDNYIVIMKKPLFLYISLCWSWNSELTILVNIILKFIFIFILCFYLFLFFSPRVLVGSCCSWMLHLPSSYLLQKKKRNCRDPASPHNNSQRLKLQHRVWKYWHLADMLLWLDYNCIQEWSTLWLWDDNL